jgi:ABC-type uncharacterized transport system auxiliary subunit
MKVLNRLILGTVCGGLLLSTGCVKLWRETLDIKTYMVETERTAEPLEKPLADKLWIDSVNVLPPFNVRNLVLRRNDVEYETSYYTEMLISPSENFRNNFYTWFASSGIFNEVSLTERRGMSHRLAVSVLKFYGDSSKEQGVAVLSVKVTLLDEQTNGMNVLFNKDYTHHIEADESTAEELIRAYNKALARILADCERDAIASLANHSL